MFESDTQEKRFEEVSEFFKETLFGMGFTPGGIIELWDFVQSCCKNCFEESPCRCWDDE